MTEHDKYEQAYKNGYAKGFEDGKKADNPYWERVTAIAQRQRDKGISTYGQGIEKNPADIIKRIEYLQEELVDALMYCEWIKDVIDKNGGSKWIPVTERLPERKCFCLTARKGAVYVEMWNGVIFSERNQMGQPTHWMPLPEAPKEV